MESQRLDKWIWCARLVKTRSLAAELVTQGKIRINGERIRKASRKVRPGDVLTGTIFGRLWVVRVLAAPDHRGPAGASAAIYQDLTPGRSLEHEAAPLGLEMSELSLKGAF